MKFDLNEVAALLHIHEKAVGHPKLKPISDAAMKHLEELAVTMTPAPAPAAEATASASLLPSVNITEEPEHE